MTDKELLEKFRSLPESSQKWLLNFLTVLEKDPNAESAFFGEKGTELLKELEMPTA